jgi:hypothetical protein
MENVIEKNTADINMNTIPAIGAAARAELAAFDEIQYQRNVLKSRPRLYRTSSSNASMSNPNVTARTKTTAPVPHETRTSTLRRQYSLASKGINGDGSK